jgi:hypothetical protein
VLLFPPTPAWLPKPDRPFEPLLLGAFAPPKLPEVLRLAKAPEPVAAPRLNGWFAAVVPGPCLIMLWIAAACWVNDCGPAGG